MSSRNLQNERTYDIMLTKYESAMLPQVFSCHGPTGAATGEKQIATDGNCRKIRGFHGSPFRNAKRSAEYREAGSTVLQEGNRRKTKDTKTADRRREEPPMKYI